jgi:prepilin-type N-terminal cleavage/methylation domain-containing protein
MTRCSRHFAPRTPAARRAFTLLELLVAATITALLAGFLAVVVGDVAGFWSRTSGRLTTEAQARIVLDQLTLDLQSAHFEDDSNTWLAATVQNALGGIPNWISNDQNPARAKPATALSLSMIAADFSSDANRFGVAGTWLRFYTTARGTNLAPFAVNASAPVAVSYQIVRRIASSATTTAAARRYLLHRAQVRPALNGTALGTLEAGQNITATAYTTTPAAGNTGANGDPRTVRAPTLDSVIADNVIDFGVRLYVRDAATVGGLRLVFPANSEGILTNNPSPATYLANVPPGGNGSDSFANRMPDVVDVSVRILTEKGADLIRGYESITQTVFAPPGVTPQAYWWELARANSRVFTRRIVLRAEAL